MHDGLYEANLFTAWMHYECYVDAATSEVLGLNAEPMLLYRIRFEQSPGWLIAHGLSLIHISWDCTEE